MVPSADSQGATRPSYFGPDSQKFSSSGLAASAAWPNTNRPNSAPSATFRLVFLAMERRSRMVGRRLCAGLRTGDRTSQTVPRSPVEVKCNAATPANYSMSGPPLFFSRQTMRFKVAREQIGASDANHRGPESDRHLRHVGGHAGARRYFQLRTAVQGQRYRRHHRL